MCYIYKLGKERKFGQMSIPPYTVAVTGVGGGVGQSVLRALRRCSLPLYIVGMDMEPWSAGLYVVDQGYLVPEAADSAYGSMLKRVLSETRAQVLIPGTDPELPALAKIRDEICAETDTFVLVGSIESIRLCRDNLATSKFFEKRGFPYGLFLVIKPKSWLEMWDFQYCLSLEVDQLHEECRWCSTRQNWMP